MGPVQIGRSMLGFPRGAATIVDIFFQQCFQTFHDFRMFRLDVVLFADVLGQVIEVIEVLENLLVSRLARQAFHPHLADDRRAKT